MKEKSDYNEIIFRNKRSRKIARQIIYSQVILCFLFILIQIIVFVLFLIKLKPYIEYFFGASITLSFGFMVYLVNCKGKNEFKIAWMLPLVIFPLFGIAAYISYQINIGGSYTRKNLSAIKKRIKLPSPQTQQTQELLKQYPKISGLGSFLLNCGPFYSYSDNRVDYYKNGESFYPQFLEEIQKAQSFIFIEFFIIELDESWQMLLEILEKKAAAGVKVYVLYDALGSIMISTKRYERFLESKGIRCRSFLPLVPLFSTQLNSRDHRKIVVIDGKCAFTGGINIKNEYFNYGKNRFAYWKDNAVKITGSAVDSFTIMFMQNWNLNYRKQEEFEPFLNHYENPETLKTTKGLVIPYADDAYNSLDVAEEVYAYILNNAKKYVHITTPYFLLDNYLFTTLKNAARRGVEVSIILPSVADHYITFCIGKTFIEDAQKENVKIYMYDKGFIHAKTFISDDVTATIGSVNLDYRSFFHHFECGTVIHNHQAVKDMEKDFEETLKDCTLLGEGRYKKIPKRQLFLGRLFRIFAPLM